MANALYTKAKEALLSGSIDLESEDIRAILVDGADYSPDIDTDDNLDDIIAAARVKVSDALASKSITNGVFNAANKVFTAVTGDQFEYIVLYLHTGTESTSKLIALLDSATGLPCTPNGGDITISWDTGANKIFKLT